MTARRLIWLVFVCSVLPRLGALWYFGLPGPTYYYHLSDSLLHRGTLTYESTPTTYMEPLYPLFLAVVRVLTGDNAWLVLTVQILVAGVGGVLLFLLTRHLSGSARAGCITAGLYAFYPYLVRQSAAYLATTLIITLLLAATYQFERVDGVRRAAGAGFFFGLLLLTRASLLPAVLCAVALLWIRRQRREAVACALAVAAVLGPWVVRCLSIDGSLLPTRVGENLFVSTFPLAGDVVPWYDVDVLMPLAVQVVESQRPDATFATERALDSTFLSLAISRMLEEPWQVAKLKVRNLAYVFVPRLLPVHMKDPRTYASVRDGVVVIENVVRRPLLWEWLHAIAATLVMLSAAVGLFMRRRRLRQEAFLGCVAVSVILVQTVFFPTTRLLAPMLFVLMFYAGCALDAALRLLSTRWPLDTAGLGANYQ